MERLVIVDTYEGGVEPTIASHRPGRTPLGLPVAELAAFLNCDVVSIRWDRWYEYETVPGAFTSWESCYPRTRLLGARVETPALSTDTAKRVRGLSVPAHDPETSRPFSEGRSARVEGLLAEGDPLLLAAYCLREQLAKTHRESRIDLILAPMWGGLASLFQFDRAAGVGDLAGIPVGVVVTDTSANRWTCNEEGVWTRPAIARRQREELSLALADLVLVFGERSEEIASRGRLRSSLPPVRTPRFFDSKVLSGLRSAATASLPTSETTFFIDGLQMPAAGTLLMLNALHGLQAKQTLLSRPVRSLGSDTFFAPMFPQSFVNYWSSRAWAHDLVESRQWIWGEGHNPADADGLRIRLQPSFFEHLSDAAEELSRGSFVVMSPAASDGIVPRKNVPELARFDVEGGPEKIASQLRRLDQAPASLIEEKRALLSQAVLDFIADTSNLSTAAAAIKSIAESHRTSISIGAVMQRQLDPRVPLRDFRHPPHVFQPVDEEPTLSVVVPCFNVGGFLRECVESVWASRRLPDEVIVVDDGSNDAATTDTIGALKEAGSRRSLPLWVIRQPNGGLAAARNAGLAAASGSFISFLDGDDLVHPEFYGVALRILAREPALGAVAAWAEVFGDSVGYWNAPQPELPLLLVENQVIVPALMRTTLLRKLGGYAIGQVYNYEDWELSIRLFAHGFPILTIPRYLKRYRVRGASLFRTMTETQNQVMRERLFFEHRALVEEFAVEVAMQIEHRLSRLRFTTVVDAQRQKMGAVGMKRVIRSVSRRVRRLFRFARLGVRR